MSNTATSFDKLYEVIKTLRSPGGCPWDREQTPLSLRGDLIEEVYECIEAIDNADAPHVKEELGDVFLLITMLSYMHEQEGRFSVSEVLDGIAEKLIRRHPHVFGELKGANLSSEKVLDNWAKIKVEQEGRKPKTSLLDSVSRGLPPLDRAWKLQKKAAKVGFDWDTVAQVKSKVEEELAETAEAIESGQGDKIEEELGDLLFAAVNLCRFNGVEPSVALQKTNAKFTRRFAYVENRMKESGEEMRPGKLDLMDKYWNEAKTLTTEGLNPRK